MSNARVLEDLRRPVDVGAQTIGFLDVLLWAVSRAPLEKLASDGELQVRQHEGFWQCMDTARDVQYLRSLCERGEQPWQRAIKAAQ